ncbi:MAG TPA: hypothetical protein VE338_15140, partial [Ktedonobacterales bacterium]|nr:hypothetical protein [Ktedonobacterales bacterium]
MPPERPESGERIAQTLPRASQSSGAPTMVMARRQALLLTLAVAALLALLGRTAWWQIAQGATLSQRAAQESVRALRIPAGRGEILDANGVTLAISVTRDTVIVDPALLRSAGALTTAAHALSTAVGLPQSAVMAQIDIP